MARPPGPPDEPGFPEAVAAPKSRWRVQLVWLVPLIAVLIGGWLAVQAILEKGPTIKISFSTGEGLEAGKTKIKFKNVDIGVVQSVVLSPDHKHVIATAELAKQATDMLVDDTRFWVVRPRISGGTVSGIGTLLSGSFIGMDIGTQKKARRDFVGLEIPPVFASGVPGREFVLKSEDLGSLDVGSPVYFRRLQVGQVTSYDLNADGSGVTMRVFINAPYDKYVKGNTRFWQASGLDVVLDTSGVKINTESLVSILVGGLAFQSPPDSQDVVEASSQTPFQLFATRTEAMQRHERIVDNYVFNFKESVRGLTVGAPVDFRGIVVGEVAAINTRYDPVTREFSIPVQVRFYPERFTSRYESGRRAGRVAENRREVAQWLVERGLRAQLRTGSLLTGQLYVALDFFPTAPKAAMNWEANPPEMPTVPGGLQSLQESVSSLVAKLNKIPFEGIGNDLRATLQEAKRLVTTLDTQVAPEARGALVQAREALNATNRVMQTDSPLQQNAADAMRELARTAAAFRALAEYLERHPEALIRGKPEDSK
ncbi:MULTISPECIES: MlaD family protein [unclassified Caballeronia]|uniref:PqiB family protein n=1 Tax=unclassified Caballeronia TaxID=2646786 RepID=UPI0028585166|nr:MULTISPECIES: MlaD family protein [unclassified Caballeronia]MDR5754697.1 MlaD family protein [Caballeronia sp. LZ024]MDR5839801.1 MlaD family protein [Caballeronia sp. LZ031]